MEYLKKYTENTEESYAKKFQKNFSFESRQKESEKMKRRHPDRIPIIVSKLNKEVPDLDKNKYLCPADLTVAQFLYVIRKRLSIGAEKSIFLFFNDLMPNMNSLLSEIYETHSNEDGFLYATYSGENTFGGK